VSPRKEETAMQRPYIAFTLVVLFGIVAPESSATTVRTPALVLNTQGFTDTYIHTPACLVLNTGLTPFSGIVRFTDEDNEWRINAFRTFPPGQVVVVANAVLVSRGFCEVEGTFLRSRVKLTLCSIAVCDRPVLPGDTCANVSEVACEAAVSSP
jgi:hypothetical protein